VQFFITGQYELDIFDVVVLSGPFYRIPQILFTTNILLGFQKNYWLQKNAYTAEESKADNIAAHWSSISCSYGIL
jgi:hypothetical protein